MATSTERRRRRRLRLHAADPRCHWCRRLTVLWEAVPGLPTPPDAATIDHLRHRLDPARRDPAYGLETRTVLACYACNRTRGVADQQRFEGVIKNPA